MEEEVKDLLNYVQSELQIQRYPKFSKHLNIGKIMLLEDIEKKLKKILKND